MENVPTTLPPMLRDELFHPAVVHFPIAFLALSGLVALAWLFFRRGTSTLLLILTLGVVGGWLGIVTGDWAEGVVNRVICDPTVTQEHEKWAEWATWAATAALPIVLVAAFRRKQGLPFAARLVAASLLLFATGSILWAGHLGASLVYQQGAAVYKPGPQCTEFEE